MNAAKKVAAYLKKPVGQVFDDVKGAAVGTVALLGSAAANAQTSSYVTSASTGISQAKDDALAVGGYVIAAVAVLIAIGWVLTMVKQK